MSYFDWSPRATWQEAQPGPGYLIGYNSGVFAVISSHHQRLLLAATSSSMIRGSRPLAPPSRYPDFTTNASGIFLFLLRSEMRGKAVQKFQAFRFIHHMSFSANRIFSANKSDLQWRGASSGERQMCSHPLPSNPHPRAWGTSDNRSDRWESKINVTNRLLHPKYTRRYKHQC